MRPEAPTQTPRTWGVVCTCSEPAGLVLGFVAHYLALGATEIHLYLDRAQPGLEALLRRIPSVRLTLCDEAHWARASPTGLRPRTVVRRQLDNAALAYAQARTNWLLHVDADEFVCTAQPLHETLAAAPDTVEYLRFRNLERAMLRDEPQHGLFDGIYRFPIPTLWRPQVPERLRNEPFARGGFSGHVEGKSIQRTGLDILPGIHSPRPLRGFHRRFLNSWTLPSTYLVHFDGLTQLHWTSKLARLMHGPRDRARMRRTEPVRDAHLTFLEQHRGDPGAVDRLYRQLKTVTAEDAAMLRALGLLLDVDLGVERSLAALHLPVRTDLSVAAFDAELARPPFAEIMAEPARYRA